MRVGQREAGGYRMLIVGVDVPRGLIVLEDKRRWRAFMAVAGAALRVLPRLCARVWRC